MLYGILFNPENRKNPPAKLSEREFVCLKTRGKLLPLYQRNSLKRLNNEK